MPAILEDHECLDTATRIPPESDRSKIPKRRPLPLSAAALFPQVTVQPSTRQDDDSDDDQETPTAAPPVSVFLEGPPDESQVLRSPLILGDQLFPRASYSEDNDVELWQNDGDTVVSIGNNVELRIDSSTIIKSKKLALIERLSELSEADSADFTEAAPFSETRIRYIIELPEPTRLDYATYCGAIRNFFAALRKKLLTGDDLVLELDQLYLTAVDLLGAQDHRDTATKFVRKYVQRLKMDDCRYMRTGAVRLLAWCERTKWEKGWIETFAHCVGMMGSGHGGVEDNSSFAELSERTRKLLHSSYRKQQLEVAALEKILKDFHVAGTSKTPENAGRMRAAYAFQDFLKEYYVQKYEAWPPRDDDHITSSWLTRSLAQALQEDFGALYDHLVDNTIIQYTEADVQYYLRIHQDESITQLEDASHLTQLPLLKVISNWNTKCDFPPIPHPWPILPRFRSTAPPPPAIGDRTSLVAAVRELDIDPEEDHIDLQQAYLQDVVTEESQPSHFVRAFLDHEAMTRLEGVSTHDARMGRWLVIYCTLQMLSRLAVDIQGLWYTSGVPYFLNCDVTNCPPWAGAKFPRTMRPASVEDSWAWLYASGIAESRRKKKLGKIQKSRIFAPRYKVIWDEEGKWELRPLGLA